MAISPKKPDPDLEKTLSLDSEELTVSVTDPSSASNEVIELKVSDLGVASSLRDMQRNIRFATESVLSRSNLSALSAMQEQADHARLLAAQLAEIDRLKMPLLREVALMSSLSDSIEKARQEWERHHITINNTALSALIPEPRNFDILKTSLATQFRFPELPDLKHLTSLIGERIAPLQSYSVSLPETLKHLTAGLSSPWVDFVTPGMSITAMANLATLGQAVSRAPFEQATFQIADSILGDWTDKPAFSSTLIDHERRSAFFIDRGLDRSITSIPEPAFTQALYSARLIEERQTRKLEIEDEFLDEDGDGHIDRERRNIAHSLLEELETALRSFINEQMEQTCGSKWVHERIPDVEGQPLASLWENKRKKAVAQGRPPGEPLIWYADFTDYKRIIIRRDNWNEVFSKTFKNKPHLDAAFDQLFPVRIDLAHSRPVTKDSFLLFVAQARQILSAIRKAIRTNQR